MQSRAGKALRQAKSQEDNPSLSLPVNGEGTYFPPLTGGLRGGEIGCSRVVAAYCDCQYLRPIAMSVIRRLVGAGLRAGGL